jgi:mannose-6-phosphate isomerase-like protein (cupin superfamily)
VEARDVGRGALVFVPPATPHAIRNIGGQLLGYVSASSPPFEVAIPGQTGQIPRVTQ